MKTDLFQSCGHCWVFQICWHIECSTFTTSSFRISNSSTGIPSPPLALFVVMLPKPHLTSHSSCLALGEWSHQHDYLGREGLFCMSDLLVHLNPQRFFCVFLPSLLNIFCFCWVHNISVLYWAHLCMKCSLGNSNFLEERIAQWAVNVSLLITMVPQNIYLLLAICLILYQLYHLTKDSQTGN